MKVKSEKRKKTPTVSNPFIYLFNLNILNNDLNSILVDTSEKQLQEMVAVMIAKEKKDLEATLKKVFFSFSTPFNLFYFVYFIII